MDDTRTFKQIFDAYANDILALAYSYTKNWASAEDITQEVFIKFWNTKDRFLGNSSVKTYLIRIAINQSKDYLKSWRHRTHIITNKFKQFSKSDPNEMLVNEEYELLSNAIYSLPPKLLEVVHLYYYEDLTYKQISELLSIPESTIKNRMLKAKALLKDKLPKEKWEVLAYE